MNLYPIESMSKMVKFYVIYSGSIYKNVGFAFWGRPSIVCKSKKYKVCSFSNYRAEQNILDISAPVTISPCSNFWEDILGYKKISWKFEEICKNLKTFGKVAL